MSQTIVIPFNDQEIGQGFNFNSRENLGMGLSMANISEDPNANGQVVRTSFNSVTTQESLMESLGISVSLDARYGLYSGGAKMDFAQSHAVNSFSSFIVGRCEVHNATRHGHGPQLVPEAQALVNKGDKQGFKTAFGDMFVRSLKTGGEFYVVARITSCSEEQQSKMAASLHAEYNGLAVSGSFKGSFETAMKETNNKSEVTVFMSQAGGIGGQASFTGPDAVKIMERLSAFPQSAHDHPVGYEVELATYDTIPIPGPTIEESEDRDIVLADCLKQKMGFLKGLSDLDFLLGPSGNDFFENLPSPEELGKIQTAYRTALNGLMTHAIKVAKGQMNPPQLFKPDPVPPPLNFKKKVIGLDDKINMAKEGALVAQTDKLVAAFRALQTSDPRLQGFDMGIGITKIDKLWGPGKQKFLDALTFQEQVGFKQGSTFVMMRNNFPNFAVTGADIADSDPEVETARIHEKAGLYWLGFDIATALFGDPAKGAQGSKSMGPGAEKIRASLGDIEHVLLDSNDSVRGFNDSVNFNLTRKK
jgi:hypothetical protein